VFGLGWGDEGKGKIVDLLSPAFDVVVRFNGGANAGHTICVGAEKFALHLLPAGVLRDHAIGVIGPGVAVDPTTLLEEIDELTARGFDVSGKLKISDRANLVLAYHKIEDQISERTASSGTRIGTTSRGIGPCYADKMRRTTAVRFADLLENQSLEERIRRIVGARRAALQAMFGDDGGLDAEAVIAELTEARIRLAPFVCETTEFLYETMEAGRSILFEGANGILLDVDHGTYPFVTSSSTGPHGIGSGAGVPASRVGRLVGVTKAYATRVGAGPFVTELDNEIGDRIRQAGNEYGTTTGRPRRCGWFDAVACRYATRISGATDIALMHLDTLSGFKEIGLSAIYRCDSETVQTMPADAARLERMEPVFEMLPGWDENLRSVRRFEDLPATTLSYISRIESLVGVPVTMVGVGPDRSQTLIRGDLAEVIEVPEASAV
jgi:adenylosuccinate synthase